MPERKRRTRRGPEPGEFQDRLSDYSRDTQMGDMERSLTEDPVTAIETKPVGTIRPDQPVAEAVALMAESNVACLVVLEDGRPVGIFSERDVLNRVADRYDTLRDRPVSDVMTPNPTCVYESDTPAKVLNLMGSGLFRHVPVVDADRKLIGIIGARRVTEYLQALAHGSGA